MLGVLEFDHLAGLDVDQMMVMSVFMFTGLVTGACAAKIVTFQNALFLEQADGPVNGGDGNARVESGGAAVQFLDIRVIFGIGQNACDHAALAGHLYASFDTKALDARFHRHPCDNPA